MTTIVQAQARDELADVRRLMQAFASWRRERQDDEDSPSEQSVDDVALSAILPGLYAPPRGRLLIAFEADQPAGSAALRDLGGGVCAVTWIFVSARFRGQRVGRALVERLLLEAKSAGYERMRLDTRIHEEDAIRLCERAGFHRMDVDQGACSDRHDQHVLFEQDLRLVG